MVMCQAGYCVMGARMLYKPETRRDAPLWRSEHEFKVRRLDLFLIRSDHARPSLSCPCITDFPIYNSLVLFCAISD